MKLQYIIFGIICFAFIGCSQNGIFDKGNQPNQIGQPDSAMGNPENVYIGLVVTGHSGLLKHQAVNGFLSLSNDLTHWRDYYPRLVITGAAKALPLLGAVVYDDQQNIIIWQLTPHDYQVFYNDAGNSGSTMFEFYALNQPQRLFVKKGLTSGNFFDAQRNANTALDGKLHIGNLSIDQKTDSQALRTQTFKYRAMGRSLFDDNAMAAYELDLKNPATEAIVVDAVYGPIDPTNRISFTPSGSTTSTEYRFEIQIVEGYEIWPGKFELLMKNKQYFSAIPGEHGPPRGYTIFPQTYTLPVDMPLADFRNLVSGNPADEYGLEQMSFAGTYGRAHGEFAIPAGGSFNLGNLRDAGRIEAVIDLILADGADGVNTKWMTLTFNDHNLRTVQDVFGKTMGVYPMYIPENPDDVNSGHIYRSTNTRLHIEYHLGNRAQTPSFPYLPFIFDFVFNVR